MSNTGLPPDLSESFFVRWVLMSQRLDADPIDLIRVAYSESGVRASAHNPHGHASGLIQFMPDTLKGLGWTKGHEAFRLLAAEDQVSFAERYFRPWAHRMGVGGEKIPQLVTDAHAYVATFLPGRLPAVCAAGEGWHGVPLCSRGKGALLSWAYAPNAILDADKDGHITAGDLAVHLAKVCRGARYDAIVYRLRKVMGEDAPVPPEPVPTDRPLPVVHDDDDSETTRIYDMKDWQTIHPRVPLGRPAMDHPDDDEGPPSAA